MNLRRKTPPDSLYLLLDTLCNAFGGIILLAVLVVLLTSKEKSQSAAGTDSPDMLQRRLTLAQTNLQQSLQLSANLGTKAGDPRWQQQIQLLSKRKEIEEAIQSARETVAQTSRELDSASAADPSARLKFLNERLAAEQTRTLEEKNRLAATKENNQSVQERLTAVEKKVTAKINDSQRPLRLPKEHDTGQNVVYVIIRYGRVYPCRKPDLSENHVDITWTPIQYAMVADPIPGKGLAPEAVGPYFKAMVANDVYLVFCVFEDSFPAFITVKQIVVSNGIAYGWQPYNKADGQVMFGSGGSKPRAQ